ncbi:hypothetical protein QQZ08_001067 [Neonectria magnoliae]|uniref:Uncharacterized protein n=1 Tax=Neonectria magnoliae TaxID=2732573 RepID=A0ABR1IHL7_9HYPO
MASADNPSNSDGSQQEETFKEQLDRVAEENRINSSNQKPNPIVQKITEYVPAAAKILGGQQNDPNEANKPEIPGPPERPHHDDKIEKFVRDQHRSNGKDGMLDTRED